MRQLYDMTYDSKAYTDENLLYKHKLLEPSKLSKNLTYLYGKDSNMFPLLSNTEGQGLVSAKKIAMNDTQYTWPTMGRMKHTSNVIALTNSTNTYPGLNFTPFEVTMEDDWFIRQHGATSPDGAHLVRIQGDPVKLGPNKFKYTMVIQGGDPTEFVSLDNFAAGKAWVMGVPTVAATKSDGNRNNKMFPGKMTNQFGFHRFSMEITGNVANKVTVVEFDLDGGGTTNMWMPFEMKTWELDRRLMTETDLWYSKYNRDDQGRITLYDEETGEAIPRGAGVKEIIQSVGNYDTYSTLTLAKLDSAINTIFGNRVDNTPMEIVLYTGAGGVRVFHDAMMSAAVSNQYFTPLGDHVISGGEHLQYGKYFNQYKTIDGKILTVRETNLFNHGLIAEMQRANGDLYMGYPLDAFNLVFLDHSKSDNGERNINLVVEKGREIITGIYKGMTNLPGSWAGIPEGKLLSSKKDEASYEILTSDGISFKNATTSFWLSMVR